jgi:hypothetical protein
MCLWRCKIARLLGGGFWVVRTRCKIAPPVENSLAQRALNLYSALEVTFAAPSFSAPVGDALRVVILF